MDGRAVETGVEGIHRRQKIYQIVLRKKIYENLEYAYIKYNVMYKCREKNYVKYSEKEL